MHLPKLAFYTQNNTKPTKLNRNSMHAKNKTEIKLMLSNVSGGIQLKLQK